MTLEHAARKEHDRAAIRQPKPGKLIGVTELPLPFAVTSQRVGPKTITPAGEVSLSLPNGIIERPGNMFARTAAHLDTLKNNTLVDVLIVTDYTGAELARFERGPGGWERK